MYILRGGAVGGAQTASPLTWTTPAVAAQIVRGHSAPATAAPLPAGRAHRSHPGSRSPGPRPWSSGSPGNPGIANGTPLAAPYCPAAGTSDDNPRPAKSDPERLSPSAPGRRLPAAAAMQALPLFVRYHDRTPRTDTGAKAPAEDYHQKYRLLGNRALRE